MAVADPRIFSINGTRPIERGVNNSGRIAVLERNPHAGGTGGGGPPSGSAGGHLTGSYPNPTILTTAQPQMANLGLGLAANSYRLAFPVSTSATDGIDFGADTSMYRASAAQIRIAPSAATSASVSAGGALNIANTANTGPGLVVYSNNGATQAGRLAVFNADNAAFDHAVVRIENAGTNAALSINNTGASVSPSALDVTSTDRTTSAIGFQGAETGKGTLKITHSHPAAASANDDANAAVLRLNWDDVAANGTAVQGIFASSEPGGPTTTGNLISMYPGPTSGTLAMRLTAAGQLQLPVNGSTGGVTMGTNLTLYRSASGVLAVEAATGAAQVRINAPDAGTLQLAEVVFHDQESSSTPIWKIRKAAGSKPLQFSDGVNAATPFLLNRQDGATGAAKFVSTFSTSSSVAGQTPGVDFQMPVANVTDASAFSQLVGTRNLVHAGGHSLTTGSQAANAGTLNVLSTTEAPAASSTCRLRADDGTWHTITYTGTTSTTLTGCTGASSAATVSAGRAVTYPSSAVYLSPIAQVNEVTVSALQTPAAGLAPPNTSATGMPEPAHYFGAVRDWTPAGSQHAQVWGFDTGVHGAVGEQQTFLCNAVFHVNNHYNGSPSLTDACGCAITTRRNLGAGGGAGPQADADTYPVDCGLIITGTTGPTNNTRGFNTGIRIGGSSAPWFSDGLVGFVDLGQEIRSYNGGGIKIWKRTSGTTGKSIIIGYDTSGTASTSAADGIDFGGDVNLFRGAADVLATDDAVGIGSALAAGPLASGDGAFIGTSGAIDVTRAATTNAIFRGNVTGDAGGTTNPRFQILASGKMQWMDGTNTAFDVAISRSTTATFRVDATTMTCAANLGVTGGTLTITNTSTGYVGMVEQGSAPAAGAGNTVRIYAVDNGAGKTQLMAIFASGAAQQLAIEP